MAQEIPNDLTLSALKIEPTSISSNPALDVNGSMVGHRRNIINLNTENASNPRILKVAESGSLIIIDNSSDVDIVVGLPTIEPGNVGTYYDFIITGVHATKSIKIKTGGHASTINEENRTNNHDSFTGILLIAGMSAQSIKPASSNGLFTMSHEENTEITSISRFRCTSITSSTNSSNTLVWFLQGLLNPRSSPGTGHDNVFTDS